MQSYRNLHSEGLVIWGLLLEISNFIFAFVFYKWSPRDNGACIGIKGGGKFLGAWLLSQPRNPITLQPWQRLQWSHETDRWRHGRYGQHHNTFSLWLSRSEPFIRPWPGTKYLLMLRWKSFVDWLSTMTWGGEPVIRKDWVPFPKQDMAPQFSD